MVLFKCVSCYNSLQSNSKKPPKYTNANGFDIGSLPLHLQQASTIERQLTNLSSIAASVTILTGGGHEALKGHVTVVTLDPKAIVRKAPDLSRGRNTFFVVISGKLTSQKKVLAKRKYKARFHAVKELLQYYLAHNDLYIDLGIEIYHEALRDLKDSGRDDVTLHEDQIISEQGIETEKETYKLNHSCTGGSKSLRLRETDISPFLNNLRFLSKRKHIMNGTKKISLQFAVKKTRRLKYLKLQRRHLSSEIKDISYVITKKPCLFLHFQNSSREVVDIRA